MNNSLTTIDFHGATLIARRGATPAETLVAMKPVAEGMGLDWNGQRQRIMRDPVLSKGACEIHVPSAGGPQLMTALPLSRLNFWLATIQPNKVPNAETRHRIICYQKECADVLFAHFFGKAAETLAPGDFRTLRNTLKRERRRWSERFGLPRRTSYRLICDRYGVDRLEALNQAQLADAIRWLRAEIRDGNGVNEKLTPAAGGPVVPPAGGTPSPGLVTLQVTVTSSQVRRILDIVEG